MVWGLMSFRGLSVLTPPHHAPRQNCHVGFLGEGSAEGDGDISDETTIFINY